MAETRQLNITPEETEAGKTMAIIAYFIFFVPLLVEDAKKNKFAMYHTEQSIVLIILNVIIAIVGTITCGIGFILYIPLLVLYIMGIIYAAKGEAKPVPLVGQYGEKFNLVK
ncbi:MAG: hypothetical protein ABSF32_08215 [Ignavibacteria bacterium]|jgi:uncharacterized membrane protein